MSLRAAQPEPAPVPARSASLAAQTPAPLPARIEALQLFAGRRELVIVHRGEEYRLRITRQEKLILTK